jgi:hypothetical protein
MRAAFAILGPFALCACAGSPIAREKQASVNYEQSFSDYRQCLIDNPNNVKACDTKLVAMKNWANAMNVQNERTYTIQQPQSGQTEQTRAIRQPQSGQTVYSASECIGPIVMGVCHGSILPNQATHQTCYGEMLNGTCTGPMF